MSTDRTAADRTRVVAGRYSLDAEIGRGGMGVVWRGEDRMLGRTVALKRVGMIPGGESGPGGPGDAGATGPDLLRAEREAQLAARLNHPHIVAVFDLAAEDDHHWLVMEYVDGRTLGQLVAQEGPLPPDEARRLLVQASDALAAAHDAGIVHRDVKPSNILVRRDGSVKLTDFGIARATADATLTRTGLVTGSPAYLAPEVASGGRGSAASDVWALGATLFHAVEGRPPYDMSDNVMAGMYQIVHGPEPRSDRAGPLAVVLEHTLVKDPEQRWTMRQVNQALADPRRLDAARTGSATVTSPTVPHTVAAPAPEHDDTPTSIAPAPVAAPVPVPAPAPGPGSGRPRRRSTGTGEDDGRRRRRVVLAVAALLLLLAAVIGLALSLTDGGGTDGTAADGDGSSSTDSGSGTGGSTDDGSGGSDSTDGSGDTSADSSGASAEELRAFAASYAPDAAADPRTTFERLTPAFKKASGGFGGYDSFWGGIASASVSGIQVDPGALTVSYTVSYQRDDGSTSEPERVTLQLEQSDGRLLIAGEG